MKRLLITTAIAALFAAPASAATVTFCTGESAEKCPTGQTEQDVFLTEGHNETIANGGVGAHPGPGVPPVLITAQTGAFNVNFDTGGGFATIDPAQGFNAFNGIDFTVPGFTFEDLQFTLQLTRQGGHHGDTEADSFIVTANFAGGGSVSHTFTDSPDDAFDYTLVSDTPLTSIDILALAPPGSGGIDQIKQIQISDVAFAAVPEPSTWAMMGAGFAFIAFLGLRKRRAPRFAV
jgi:hypothetical protein